MEQQFEHINDDLLVKYLLGEASAWEQEAVRKWIADDAANKQYFEQFELIWNTSKELELTSTADENQAWQRFQQRVNNGNVARSVAPVIKTGISWMRIAAAVAILVTLSIIGYVVITNSNKDTDKPLQMAILTTNQTRSQGLSDGTLVTLNKNSSLSYPSRFKGRKREVKLRGEAFFNVTPDRDKPFVIQANDVEITVVGTSFNVRTQGAVTEVVVESGIVRVTKEGKTIELKAGERSTVSAESGLPTKEKVTDKLYNYYRTKEFVCDDTPLWKLVQVINEAYDVNIEIGRPEKRNEKINTTFYNESLDKVLEVISQTHNLTVEKNNDRIILK